MGKRLCKTPELMRARNALIKFLEGNSLNPAKDYSKHPIFGKEYRELLLTLNIERDKVLVRYPQTDIKNFKKYYKMKKEKKDKKAAKAAAPVKPEKVEKKAKKASKKEKVEKKAATTRTGKYDYPLVDGREMTSDEKKKYRAEQRKLAKGGEPKAKAEKKAKKDKKAKEEKKAPKVGKKDKKKAKKDED